MRTTMKLPSSGVTRYSIYTVILTQLEESNLDGVGKQLVQFRDLGCHAVIDCLLADFDHQTSEKIWVDLCGYLELLALAVLRL